MYTPRPHTPSPDVHTLPSTNDDLEIFQTHIQESHATSSWSWQHAHDPRWRSLFYDYLYAQSLKVEPLTTAEAQLYETSLVSSLPTDGFFPPPEIAAKSIALARMYTRPHPAPSSYPPTSRLCAPGERHASAQAPIPRGTFLGFYTGWIRSTSSSAYVFRVACNSHHILVDGWDEDTTDSIRERIFPFSYINEYIWNEENSQPNNLRSNTFGGITSRQQIRRGVELTMGMGLYDYDWSRYKRTLLADALTRLMLICEAQMHTEYYTQLQTLSINLASMTHEQYLLLRHSSGPLHTLFLLVEGDNPPIMYGSILIHDMSLSAYIHQLSGVPEFTRVNVFRMAHHPERRHPRYYDWHGFIAHARAAHTANVLPDVTLRRSARLSTSHNLLLGLTSDDSSTPTAVRLPGENLTPQDYLVSLSIFKHHGMSRSQVAITNEATVNRLLLPTHTYTSPVTIVMPDGSIHYPSHYAILGNMIGEAAILPISHSLIPWDCICVHDYEIHQNSRRLKILRPDGTTLLRIPTLDPHYSALDIRSLLHIQLPIASGSNTTFFRSTGRTRARPHMHLTDETDSHKTQPSLPTAPSLTATMPPSTTTVTAPLPPLPEDYNVSSFTSDIDSCASTDDSVDDLPEVEMINDFALPRPIHTSKHVRMAWCNIAGCDDIQKIERVMALVRIHKIDILCMTDTRVTSTQWGNALRAAAIQRLGVGATVEIFLTTKGDTPQSTVGGQIIIKSPRIPQSARSFIDPSGCAVVAGIDLHIGSTDVRIISTYWPGSVNMGTHLTDSLWSKLQKFLSSRNDHMTPLEYIQTYILRKVQGFGSSTNSLCIVGGDFNATRTASPRGHGVHPPISGWAAQNALCHVFDKLALPPAPTYYAGTVPKLEIDHILYTPTSDCHPTDGGVLDDDAWAQESDHRPVMADFSFPRLHLPHVSKWKRRRRRAKVVDISRTNKREVSLFQSGMLKKRMSQRPTATMTPDELHRQLQRIHHDTYRVASTITMSARRKVGNWTPHMVALRCRHGALVSIARITRHMTTDSATLHSRIKAACARWRHTLASIHQTQDESAEWGRYLGEGPEYWESLPPWEACILVSAAIRRSRRTLNGRKCVERRHRFLDTLARRKQSRQNGKHLAELKALLGTPSSGSMIDVLEEGGQRITDPHEIASHATDFFNEWHQKKEIDYGFHAPCPDTQRLLADREFFLDQHRSTGIPTHLLDALWRALQSPTQTLRRHPRMVEDLHASLERPPSFAEFREALHSSKRQSSAGMSGVTYNLMSLWPTAIAERVHEILCAIWTHKSTPPFWKWRWLVPIPKRADNNTLANLRPISLIETSRKLWIGIFINRIKDFWTRSGILCASQHAFLADKSTEGALLQFRNIMEETEECATDHYLSSWDIKRAFDRVPKNILILSWVRLGVPPPVAEYMVGLDMGGTTVIRTPYTERRYQRRGHSTFTRSKRKTPSFVAEVGTGQGDVGSPLNWIAFFDILLCALDEDDTDRPLLRAKGSLHRSRDTGYADDLVSITTTLSGLQRKADIVSAFAIMFGLDIAVAKLRACKVEWGHENPGLRNDELHVHTHGWHLAPIQTVSLTTHRTRTTAEALKYLGVLFDYANDDSSSHAALMQLLNDKLQLLHTRTCDKELKIEAITVSLYAKLRYPGRMAGWRLQDFYTFDKTFSAAFRRILQLPRTFPHALLYASRKVGGIGLPLFSTQVHKDKIAMLNRGLLGDTSTNVAMEGLLERGLRANYQTPSTFAQTLSAPASHRLQTDPTFAKGKTSLRQSLWIHSLLEWLAIGNIHIHRHGSPPTGPNEPIRDFYARHLLPLPPPNGARQLDECGLYTITDLTRWDPISRGHVWNMDIIRDTPFLRPVLQLPPPAPPFIPLLPGQCWATSTPNFPAAQGYIWEYLGRTGCQANVRIWKTDLAHTINSTARLISPSRGGGTDINIPYEELLLGPAFKLVLSGDIADRRGVHRRLISSRPQLMPQLNPPSDMPFPVLRSLVTQNLTAWRMADIFTDGSCSPHTSLLSSLLGHRSSHTSGAIIIKEKGDKEGIGSALHISDGHLAGVHTAYGMEMATAAIATAIRHLIKPSSPTPLHIYSDSKAAVHGAHSCSLRRRRRLGHKRMGFFAHHFHRTRQNNVSTIHHCFSHPERRKSQSKFTAVDVGNSLADAISSPRYQDRTFAGLDIITFPLAM